MDSPQGVGREAGNTLLVAAGRSRVGRLGRVDRGREGLLHASTRIGHDLHQVVQTLVAQSRHVLRRERGPLDQLREQLERGLQARRRHLHRGDERVPRRLHVESGAQTLSGLDQLHARIAFRALGHRARRQDGGSRQISRLVAGAAPEDQIRRHQGPAGNVNGQHLQARGQDRPLERREAVGARLAGRWALGQDLLERHAAVSSSVAPVAPS